MKEAHLSPLFTWRSAVASEAGPSDYTLTVEAQDGSGTSELGVKGSTQRHVALSLSLHMNERGGSCYPGIPRLARESGLTERTVQKALRALAATGWLDVKIAAAPGGANLYTATIPDGYVHEPGGVATTPGVSPETPGGVATTPEVVTEDEDLTVEPDGSTALAVPEPTEVGPKTAQTLVADFVDGAAALSVPLPRRTIGQVAKYVGELLNDDGIPYDAVEAGLKLMLQRGQMKPALLANFVVEAGLPRSPPQGRRYGYGVGSDELEQLAHRLEQEGR